MNKKLTFIFLVFVLLTITACSSQVSNKCAQQNANICDDLSEGDSVPSCDTCNDCGCNEDSEGNMYALCTEMDCE